jgi:hypothetical protein
VRLRDEARLALAVPRWAWGFYRQHLVLIVGLSLIPSVQRLIVVNWTDDIPEAIAFLSEVVVMGVRLGLVVLVWWLAMRGERWGRSNGRAFLAAHWVSLVIQGGLIMAAAMIFDTGLEQVVGGLFPESAQQTYLAVLLFVKNPTIIAFTFVWMVGIVRQVLCEPSTSDESAGRGEMVR